jgi:hypothetical protein
MTNRAFFLLEALGPDRALPSKCQLMAIVTRLPNYNLLGCGSDAAFFFSGTTKLRVNGLGPGGMNPFRSTRIRVTVPATSHTLCREASKVEPVEARTTQHSNQLHEQVSKKSTSWVAEHGWRINAIPLLHSVEHTDDSSSCPHS